MSKSQIAFRARRGFPYVWRPGFDNDVPPPSRRSRYPPDKSKRFKSVVHPSPKVWIHHLEVRDPDQVDDEVARSLRDAYHAAS